MIDEWPTPATTPLEQRLRGHVNVLAGLIGPRYPQKPSTMEAAAAYVERQFGDIGDVVTRQAYRAGDAEGGNRSVFARTRQMHHQSPPI